jgi:Fe-S-cluster containining protein
MTEPIINPCAGCPVNCCRDLRKLKLSPSEYQRVYEPFREQFDFERKGSLYELSMYKGLSCPHLGELDRCTIYETRPAECRLFPYTVNQTYHTGPLILFTYHGKTPCPRKEILFPSHKEARRLVRSLARETYGSGKIVLVCYEGLIYRAISKLTRLLCLKKIAHLFRR